MGRATQGLGQSRLAQHSGAHILLLVAGSREHMGDPPSDPANHSEKAGNFSNCSDSTVTVLPLMQHHLQLCSFKLICSYSNSNAV